MNKDSQNNALTDELKPSTSRVSSMIQVVLSCGLLIATASQDLTLATFGSTSLKLIHVLVICLFLISINKLRIVRESIPLFIFYFFLVVWSLLVALSGSLDPLIANYAILLVAIIGISSTLSGSDKKYLLVGLQIASFIIAAATVVNIILNFDQIRIAQEYSLESGARAQIDGPFFSGGINIEATWISLYASFFLKKPKILFVYLILASAVSFSYTSRSGFIAMATVIGCFFLFSWNGWLRDPKKLMSAIVLIPLSVWIMSLWLPNTDLWKRMNLIGEEAGSLDRLQLWDSAIDAISARPLSGWGIGNELATVQSMGYSGAADNLHNSFLTFTLYAGVLGSIMFIITTFSTLVLLRNKITACVLFVSYTVCSFVEFRGAELPMIVPLILLLVGSKDSTKVNEKIS